MNVTTLKPNLTQSHHTITKREKEIIIVERGWMLVK